MSSAIPETLISDYLDEQLDAEQFEVLRQWILADDAHARLFLRRAAVHRLAREHFVAAELVAMMGADDADSLDELDLGFDGAIDADAVIAAVEADQRHHEQRAAEALSHQEQQAASAERSWDAIVGRSTIDITPIRHIVIPRWLAYGSGAALAASVLLMLYTLFGFGHGAETPLQPQPGPTTDSVAVAPTSTSIGQITGAVAVKWDDAGVALNMGDPLPALPLRLTHGVVELTFDQGAKVLIEAPAQFEPRSADRLVLTAGRLTGEVPPHANGFTVNTPSATVIDLGTAFGITVEEDASAATEVHVFDGQVALATPAGDGQTSFQRRLLEAGEAGRVDDQGLRPLAFAPGAFLRALPTAYELLVRRSEPVFYGWLAEHGQRRMVKLRGKHNATLTLVEPIVLPEDLRPDGTRGPVARFTADHQGVTIGVLPEWRDQTANFTLEAWIKPKPHARGNNRILSNLDGVGGLAWGIAGRDNTFNAPPRSMVFSFFTVADYASIVPVEPGRWSHVVVTVDKAGYPTFYLNGEEAGTLVRSGGYIRMHAAAEPKRGNPSMQPLVIGNNPPLPRSAPANYVREAEAAYMGDLEHVAIYDHTLSPETIRMHYLVGLGASIPDQDLR